MSGLFAIENEFHYEIVRKIAEGGMGIVYEARQLGARDFIKRVAIKVIRQNFADQKSFIDNFIGEAKLVADLIHTNIVQTYHLGITERVHFIAMELIRGVNLEQFSKRLKDHGQKLPMEFAVFVASRIARGLSYAHSKTDENGVSLGIVHRDVSFKNVMIGYEGDVKLTDFGIAKAQGFLEHQEGEVIVGKPEYMSPEQADFRITDGRSDIFSTGIVLSQLLLGKNVFRGTSAEATRNNILRMPIPDFTLLDARIDSRLNQILHRSMARNMEERYPAADELLYDLEHYIYSKGYGPTNEKMGKLIREVFVPSQSKASAPSSPDAVTIKISGETNPRGQGESA